MFFFIFRVLGPTGNASTLTREANSAESAKVSRRGKESGQITTTRRSAFRKATSRLRKRLVNGFQIFQAMTFLSTRSSIISTASCFRTIMVCSANERGPNKCSYLSCISYSRFLAPFLPRLSFEIKESSFRRGMERCREPCR